MANTPGHGSLIYLDNAATSWPKPPGVSEAMSRVLQQPHGNAGRGGHGPARASARIVERLRERLAALIGASTPERVVFASGCTDALNTIIHGVVRAARRSEPGTTPHVVSTVMEHNAVLRPLHTLEARGEVRLTLAPADEAGRISAQVVASECKAGTALVVLAHAGNVTGAIQPVAEVAAAVRATCPEALIVVDAAQSAGSIPINIAKMGIDLLALSAHKVLLGPMGAGALYIGPRAYDPARGVTRIESVRQGGTGSDSTSLLQPKELPAAFEAGTLPMAALAGWLAALDALDATSVERERAQCGRIMRHFAQIPGVRMPGPSAEDRVGVVSLDIKGVDPLEAAAVLDESFSIAVRAGLDCAPLAHRALGTFPRGMLRVSPGPSTTDAAVDTFIRALEKVIAALRG